MSSESPVSYAALAHEGRICPHCGEAVHHHQMIHMCPECGAAVHHRCWESAGGCACGGAAVAPPREAPRRGAIGAPLTGRDAAAQPPDNSRDQRIGVKVAVTLIVVLIPLLGPMIGIVVSFLWLDPQRSGAKRRDGRELLIISVVLFMLHLSFLFFRTLDLFGRLEEGLFSSPRGLGPLP
jgi:predicted RNA-binding Zn-ribbon protein involved in translation (DUF1610 family)